MMTRWTSTSCPATSGAATPTTELDVAAGQRARALGRGRRRVGHHRSTTTSRRSRRTRRRSRTPAASGPTAGRPAMMIDRTTPCTGRAASSSTRGSRPRGCARRRTKVRSVVDRLIDQVVRAGRVRLRAATSPPGCRSMMIGDALGVRAGRPPDAAQVVRRPDARPRARRPRACSRDDRRVRRLHAVHERRSIAERREPAPRRPHEHPRARRGRRRSARRRRARPRDAADPDRRRRDHPPRDHRRAVPAAAPTASSGSGCSPTGRCCRRRSRRCCAG